MTAPTPAALGAAPAPPTSARRPAEAVVLYVSPRDKPTLLSALVARLGGRCVLFTATKGGADAAARAFGPGAAVVHGGRSAAARRRAIQDYRSGTVAVLIATDLPDGALPPGPVVFADVPTDSGAALRHLAAAAGHTAAIVCTAPERQALRAIERASGGPATVADDHPWHCPAAERDEPRRPAKPHRPRAAPFRRGGKRIFRDPTITHVGGWI